MNVFDYVNNILKNKKELDFTDNAGDEYNPFIVNRALSLHKDCILQTNEMNRRPFIDKKMQNDFLLNTIRGYKRPYIKWLKMERSEHLPNVMAYFKFSNKKAQEILNILSDDQLKEIKRITDRGGV